MLASALLLRAHFKVQRAAPTSRRYGSLRVVSIPANAQQNTTLNVGDVRDTVTVCDEIDSLAVMSTTDVSGVTAFVAEACASTEVLGGSYTGSALLSKDRDLQNLTDYFERPRLARRYTLTAGSRSVLEVFDVNATTLFNNSTGVFLNGLARMTGVFGLRFKLKLRLQVAATPFHQGIVYLSWQYHCSAAGAAPGIFNRGGLVQTATNLPHVRLDLSQQTMVELEIPFVHTNEFMTLTEGNWPYGAIGVGVLLPYESVAGMGAPTLEMYFSLHDIEFYGASPQGTTTIVPQSGLLAESESDARPFSSAAGAAARSIRFLAKGVPAISSFAMPVSWFLDCTAGALRAFGFSKPTVKDPVPYVLTSRNIRETNVDVPSSAIVVGPKCDNQLAVSHGFGCTDVDDMAISYITSQWGQICVGNLPTSLAHGSALYATRVSPSYFWFRAPSARPLGNRPAPITSTATTNSFIPSSLFFISSMFRSWRGGIRFRFTFSKTKMHSGRLLCTFVPNPVFASDSNGVMPNVLGPESVGGVTQPFGHSAIFDLKDNNVFEFDVPYIVATPYMPFWASVGDISLVVIDPLVAPSNVAQQVGVLVEVCGSSDFELAQPVSPPYASMGNTAAGATIMVQSGLPTTPTTASSSTLTMGEKIMSVKQLIMLPKWTDTIDVPAGSNSDMRLPPWFFHRNPPVTAPYPAGTTFPEAFGIAGNLATAYTWARGSTEYHVYEVNPGANRSLMVAKQSRIDYNIPYVVASGQKGFRGDSSTPMVISTDGVLHAKFPAYTQTARVSAAVLNDSDYSCKVNYIPTSVVTSPSLSALPVVNFNNTTGALTNVRIGRAAGDDAALSMYIGPCPLALLQSGSISTDIDPDIAF